MTDSLTVSDPRAFAAGSRVRVNNNRPRLVMWTTSSAWIHWQWAWPPVCHKPFLYHYKIASVEGSCLNVVDESS